jgi:hypothetical protein
MGFVEIGGKVDVFQYWPHGASDVDTLKFIPDPDSATYFSAAGSTKVWAFFENGGTFRFRDDYAPGLMAFGGMDMLLRCVSFLLNPVRCLFSA